jgi:uncharacterized protein
MRVLGSDVGGKWGSAALYAAEITRFQSDLQTHPVLKEVLNLGPVARLKHVSFVSPLCTSTPNPISFSRYEHSLGVAYLASRAAQSLGLSSEEPIWEALVAAALLHDVGHSPFSHITEQFLFEQLGRYHLYFTLRLIRSLVRARAELANPLRVAYEVLAKRNHYSHLLYGLGSADNVDGVFRSHLFFGTPSFDPGDVVDQVYRTSTPEPSLLEAIWSSTRDVYDSHLRRPEVLASEAMISRALEIAAEHEPSLAAQFQQLDDSQLLTLLRRYAANLIRQLESKRFFVPLARMAPHLHREVVARWEGRYLDLPLRLQIGDTVARRLTVSPESVIAYCKPLKEIRRPGPLTSLGKSRRRMYKLHIFVHQ